MIERLPFGVPVASDSCQVCGPSPQECPTVLCAPCLMVATTQSDQVCSTDPMTWSFKRLAWAFGCAAKNSDLEIELFRALKTRIGNFRP